MTHTPSAVRRVILHLGGDPGRIATTIAYAVAYPDAAILISSETEPARLLEALDAAMIPLRRVTFDFAAWDTVSNFTETRTRVLAMGATELIPVTGRSHMHPRAAELAAIAYHGTGVRITPAVHDDAANPSKESPLTYRWDVVRMWLWYWTGVPLYNPWLRWRRMKQSIRPAAAALAVLQRDALGLAAAIGGRA